MFHDPWYLLGALPLLALAAGAYAWGARRRARLERQLGDVPTLRRLIAGQAPRRRALRAGLRLAALALLMLALAGPQWGVELVETRTQARQVMIAVDVSLSMLAEDVKPSRLARAKQELSLLIDELKGARVGVMAFAGQPVVVCPLTTDTEAAKQLLATLDPSSVPVPGTAIGTAIRRATQAMSRYPGAKSLVILTDGEDHKTDPGGAAEEAAAQGIKIFAIGIGNPEGEPIPVRDANGAVVGYKKDKRGQTVMSRLGEGDLSLIAQKTGGAYYRSSPGASEASEIAQKALGAASDDTTQGSSLHLRNRFMIPLALAFLLLLAEWLIPESASATRSAPAKTATLAALALLGLLPARASAATAESALRRGNALYDDSKYEPALEQYGMAGRKNPRDRRPVFNAGDALYRLQQYDKAAEAFKAVAESGGPADVRSQAYYNLGNAYYQQGDYAQAVGAYRKAVALRPGDADARLNLAVALRRLKNPPPKKKPNKNDDKKDDRKQPPPQNKDQNKSSGGGQQPPPQPKTRPQDQMMSKEDAQRIMRAVQEREKATPRTLQRAPLRKPDVEEDW